MKQIDKLKQAMLNAMSNGDYAKAKRITDELEKFNTKPSGIIRQSVKELINEDGGVEQHKELIQSMHLMLTYCDLLQSASIDFQSKISKLDKTARIEIVNEAGIGVEILRRIVARVDSVGIMSLSEQFGDMCDEINLVAENIINKYMTKR